MPQPLARQAAAPRRAFLQASAAALTLGSTQGWLARLAAATGDAKPKRACILLWMNGGPSHLDTFDPKPDHENGGPFKAIETSAPGIRIAEHLPQVARWMHRSAVIRSMTGKEADHGRATYLVRTGRPPEGVIQYPTLGSLVSNELGNATSALPNYVAVAPYRSTNLAAYNPGFLGPPLAPFIVGDVTPAQAQQQDAEAYLRQLRVGDLRPVQDLSEPRATARLELLRNMESRFAGNRPDGPVASHKTAYQRAVRLTEPDAVRAFNLDDEPAKLRDAYGRNLFGEGCLLARRLIERGVPFVEVSLGGVNSGGMGWDTHVNNFETVQKLCGVLDPAWAALLADLDARGMLDSTLVVWMGEFGRTPKINGSAGRDHYPLTWSAVLSGGGVRGGQVVGRTSADGTTVEDRPCAVPELLATVCQSLGIDPHKTNESNIGRPIHLVDYDAQPLAGVVP